MSMLCYTIGMATSLHDCFRNQVVFCPDLGFYVVTETYTSAQQAMELVRMITRMICMFGLCIMVAVVSLLYRWRRSLRPTRATTTTGQSSNMRRENQNPPQEPVDSKLLTALLAIQACSALIGFTPLVVLYMVIYFPQAFPDGSLRVMWTVVDCTIVIGMSWNFGCYALTSKRFRTVLRDVICRNNNVITPFGTSTN